MEGGIIKINNKQLKNVIERGIIAHEKWMERLTRMCKTGTISVIQINGNKCGFGHFYRGIQVHHPAIEYK